MILYQTLAFTTHWKIKLYFKNKKLKILVPKFNGKLELHDESYSVSDNQGYFEYIIKKHETLTDNSSIKTMKLLGSTKNKINKHENKSMVILLAMIITKIQESYIYLFLKNLFANY